MQIFHHTNFNFVRWRWHAIALSWVIVLAGLVTIWRFGMPLGVEFSGGTIVIVRFDQLPDSQQVRSALDQAMPGVGQNAIINRYGDPASRQLMIRVPMVGEEAGGSLSKTADAVAAALNKANFGKFEVAGTEIVGPSVGEQLR